MPKSCHRLHLHHYKSCHPKPTGCNLLFCPCILIYSTSWTKRQLSQLRCLTLQFLCTLKVRTETVYSIGWSWVALSGYFLCGAADSPWLVCFLPHQEPETGRHHASGYDHLSCIHFRVWIFYQVCCMFPKKGCRTSFPLFHSSAIWSSVAHFLYTIIPSVIQTFFLNKANWVHSFS